MTVTKWKKRRSEKALEFPPFSAFKWNVNNGIGLLSVIKCDGNQLNKGKYYNQAADPKK
jgi:hypothetical protein